MRIFLDLEGTVIDEWSTMKLINIRQLAHFFRINRIDEVSIFSFAINSEDDKQTFDNQLRYRLETILEVKINITDVNPITDEICERELLEFEDVCYFLNKFRTFTEFAIHHCQGETVILLDDEVPNTDMNFKDNNLRVITIDVTKNAWEDTLIN